MRRLEIIIGILGTLIYAFNAFMGGMLIWLKGNEEETVREFYTNNPDASEVDVDTLISSMDTSGWVLIILSVLAIVLGIIAMVLLKEDKKPKVAGIIFIATATITMFFGMGIMVGAAYFIAGLLCFFRKPQPPLPTLNQF